MANWELVPCLVQLRTELNRIAPNRDKSSDGTIGDTAHQSRVSDHNDDEVGRVPIKDADKKHEVHAYDADVDLNEFGLTMLTVILFIVNRCRLGMEKRLRYIIFNRFIWEASNGWKQRAYTGDNPHTQHAHFSASYETKLEASTASWRLEDIPVALTDADKKWLEQKIDAAAVKAAKAVWDTEWDIEPSKEKTYVAKAGNILKNMPAEHTRQEVLLHDIKTTVTTKE